jgi:hypothetical protein
MLITNWVQFSRYLRYAKGRSQKLPRKNDSDIFSLCSFSQREAQGVTERLLT